MFGEFSDDVDRFVRGTRGLVLFVLCLAMASTGCNQNANNMSAWNNPFAPTPPAPGSPYYDQYMAAMRQQTQQQYAQALEQQQRLAELEGSQQKYQQQQVLTQQQELAARQRTDAEKARQDELIAQRAREAVGRYDELGQRARSLDLNNQDLHARVAKVQQRTQLLEDQNHLLRQQLDDTSRQLSAALEVNKKSEQRIQTMMASTPRRSGATITANNSYRRNLTAVTIDGLQIRQDGELVRIEMSSERLFEPGTANLRPDAAAHIDHVASVLVNNYSRQVIGVEAHTDSVPANSQWRNAHQLTAAQAMAVFEQLSYRHQLLPQQMFVLGHGSNYALASNATDAGRLRNRRVEIVIYPDTLGRR